MLAKKFRDVISDFAKDKGINEDHAELIIMSVFKEVDNEVEKMEYDYLRITGFGDFFLKIWTVARERKALENIIKSKKIVNPKILEIKKEIYTKILIVEVRMKELFYKRKTEAIQKAKLLKAELKSKSK